MFTIYANNGQSEKVISNVMPTRLVMYLDGLKLAGFDRLMVLKQGSM